MGLTIRCAECHSHKYDPITHDEYYSLLDFFNQSADADTNDESPRLQITLASSTTEQQAPPIEVPVLVELPPAEHRRTHVMLKGNYLALGQLVSATTPAAFPEFPPGPPAIGSVWHTGYELRNPLHRPVTVNRFWARLFGTGIVETEEDFGTQGAPHASGLVGLARRGIPNQRLEHKNAAQKTGDERDLPPIECRFARATPARSANQYLSRVHRDFA